MTEIQQSNILIEKHFDRIRDWAIGDIKRCCNFNPDGTCSDNGALVGAFILWCCAIDYYGGLLTSNSDAGGGTKHRMAAFIGKYMPIYDADLIIDLRWSLLHYYSPNHFLLMHENEIEQARKFHLLQTERGIILHLGCSIRDLETAINQYEADLKSDNKLKLNLYHYYQSKPIIMPVKQVRVGYLSSSASGTAIPPLSASGTVGEFDWYK